MKKWFFAVSLIIIAAGLAIAATGYYPIIEKDEVSLAYIHNVPLQNRSDGVYYLINGTESYGTSLTSSQQNSSTVGVFIPSNATKGEVFPNPAQWTISANLTEGDLLTVPIRQGFDWPEGYFEIDENLPAGTGALYVDINITDPRGNFTLFNMVLGKTQGSASSQFYYLQTYIIDVSDPANNQGGLDLTPFDTNTSLRYLQIGGRAQYTGIYTVTVSPPWPNRNNPPTSIEMRKIMAKTVYTMQYTLPAGMTMLVAGVALTWVSVKKKSKTLHDRRAYTEMKRQR